MDVSKLTASCITASPIHHALDTLPVRLIAQFNHSVLKSWIFRVFFVAAARPKGQLLNLRLRLQDETAELNQRIQRVPWPNE